MDTTKVIPISSIKAPIYVRNHEDEEYVLSLAMLIEGGTKLPAIKVIDNGDDTYRLVDGMHRIKANETLGNKTILTEIITVADELDQIAIAWKSNQGGARPPTVEDYRHTAELLYNRGINKQTDIAKIMNIPISAARKVMKDAISNVNKRKLREAVKLITHSNQSIVDAATQLGVRVDDLKRHISGGKRKGKKLSKFSGYMHTITFRGRSYAHYHADMMGKIRDDVLDGLLSQGQLETILAKLRDLSRKHNQFVDRWEERIKQEMKG